MSKTYKLHHVGDDFTVSFNLNLLPHIHIKRGYYQLWLSYVTQFNDSTSLHHLQLNCGPEELQMRFGRDVRRIEFLFQCHNSFPTNPLTSYRYQMSMQHLILLNLACKLLKYPKI